MHDINPHIARLISPACGNIELSFPKGTAEFPLVTISEISNSSSVVLDGAERFSGISVQLDVWDNSRTREKCEETACKVSELMIRAGFRRISSSAPNEEYLWRRSMTFSGTVDEKTFIVYERS